MPISTTSDDANSDDATTAPTESAVRFVPVTWASENPLECCNIKLCKALKFLAILFIVTRAAILTFYLYLALNTVAFLQFYIKNRGSNGILQFAHGIRIASTLLWIKELIFILSTFLLLFVGAIYRKYEFLKCWVIFTSLHETLGLLTHLGIGFFMSTPILAFHLPLTLPFLSIIIWLNLRLMHEIKAKKIRNREQGPRLKIGKEGTKWKNLYNNNMILPPKKPQVFIESENPYF